VYLYIIIIFFLLNSIQVTTKFALDAAKTAIYVYVTTYDRGYKFEITVGKTIHFGEGKTYTCNKCNKNTHIHSRASPAARVVTARHSMDMAWAWLWLWQWGCP
jgi:hypothetical protein